MAESPHRPAPLLRPGTPLVLASSSPRRRELLEALGLSFDVRPADIDEAVLPDEGTDAYVLRLAEGKARASASARDLVVGADTCVDVGGSILGKPDDEHDARAMLEVLSGTTAVVHSGVAVVGPDLGAVRTVVVRTEIDFTPVAGAELDWYVATAEWEGRAGAFSIQGAGGLFVEGLRGSFSNVVGLPLAETAALLRAATDPGTAEIPGRRPDLPAPGREG